MSISVHKIIGPNTNSKLRVTIIDEDYVKTGYCRLQPDPGSPNFIWEGHLYPIGFSRGRSSVRFKLMDDVRREYEMSVNNVAKLLTSLCAGEHLIMHGEKGVGFFGLWTYAKEGSNLSVVPYYGAIDE